LDDGLCLEVVEKLQDIDLSESVVILATYNKSPESPYINYLLSKLGGQSIIAINNTNDEHFNTKIIKDNIIWVDRPNYLRDIGAYRLGLKAICLNQKIKPNKIILMNDSYYILREEFFDQIAQAFDGDVVAHSFSTKPMPHFRSYFLSIKPVIFAALNEYLNKIPPTKSRYCAIKFGELGMSQNIFLNHVSRILPIGDHFNEKNKLAYVYHLSKLQIALSEVPNKIALKRLHYDNESLDPYNLKEASDCFIPAIIKREVYEKGLASMGQCLFWIKLSDIPEHIHQDIIKDILINTRIPSIANRFKRMIGEI
jgi:hypothetical protein